MQAGAVARFDQGGIRGRRDFDRDTGLKPGGEQVLHLQNDRGGFTVRDLFHIGIVRRSLAIAESGRSADGAPAPQVASAVCVGGTVCPYIEVRPEHALMVLRLGINANRVGVALGRAGPILKS